MKSANLPRKRPALAELSNLKFGDFLNDPNQLVDAADLASAGIVKSYSTLGRWIKCGKVREPIRLANRNVWRAGWIIEDLGFENTTSALNGNGRAKAGS